MKKDVKEELLKGIKTSKDYSYHCGVKAGALISAGTITMIYGIRYLIISQRASLMKDVLNMIIDNQDKAD